MEINDGRFGRRCGVDDGTADTASSGPPDDGNPGNGAPGDGSPGDGGGGDGAPRAGGTGDGGPADGSADDGSADDGSADDGSADDSSPDDEAPDDGSPGDGEAGGAPTGVVNDRGANLAMGSIGVVSALCGPVVAIIAIFRLSDEARIFWSVALTITAFLVGAALFAWLHTRKRLFGSALALAIFLNFGLMLGLSFSYQRVVDSTKHSCLAPGEGGGPYVAAFREAFARKGGAAVLGCATSPVVPLAGGMHQNFIAPDDALTVIFAYEPGHAVALDPDDWIGYHSIRGPVESTIYAGFQ